MYILLLDSDTDDFTRKFVVYGCDDEVEDGWRDDIATEGSGGGGGTNRLTNPLDNADPNRFMVNAISDGVWYWNIVLMDDETGDDNDDAVVAVVVLLCSICIGSNDLDSNTDAMEKRSVWLLSVFEVIVVVVVAVLLLLLLQYNSHCSNCVCKNVQVVSWLWEVSDRKCNSVAI